MPATGPINSGHTQYHDGPVRPQQQFLRLAQHLAGRSLRLGRTGFGHETAVILGVDTRAAGKNVLPKLEMLEQVLRSFQKDSAIFPGSALRGRNSVHNPIELDGEARDVPGTRDITRD